ncbi:aldehyde dehydrogenase family protein, partial [Escherichia coli]
MAYPDLYLMIDGQRLSGGGRRTHVVVNPATGAALADLPLADATDLDAALAAAQRGFHRWRDSTPQE